MIDMATPTRYVLTALLVVFAINVNVRCNGQRAADSGRALERRGPRARQRLITGDDGEEDVAFQSCSTPNGEAGHCRHVRFCVLDEFRDNFDRFRDYACVIGGRYIGVCCPDDDRDLYDKSRDFPRSPPSDRNRSNSSMSMPSRRRRPRPVNVQNRDGGVVSPAVASCGVAMQVNRNQNNGRVEGGRETVPGQYPWMAALLRDGLQQFCGGVLLDPSHVLTAGHCVNNLDTSALTVGLGEFDLSRPDPSRVQLFRVADILVNERFDPEAYTDDIALLYLEGQVQYSDFVQPICLPPPDIQLAGQLAVVIGWGTVYYGGPPSNVLMEVTLPVWSQQDCQRQFDQPILDTEICAGAVTGGRDSCQGDSGGPLLLQMSDGRWCNIGIVSFGVRCGEPGKPGVYTNVAKYLDWIAQNTRG